jgi:hypothetical protein
LLAASAARLAEFADMTLWAALSWRPEMLTVVE